MTVQLNHTIVHAKDKKESAEHLARILGLEVGPPMGPFLPVTLAGGVTLDYAEPGPDVDIHMAHYAFLVSEQEFDEIWARIKAEGLTFFADPHGERVGEINHNDGGRGLYWLDPSGHGMEIITRPYGSGDAAAD
ncbi:MULTISPECIES: VOC family protein [Streptomyces]|uniref:VOC family protein n=1 Tax=Streptomyces lycii TaxID=2654337 RepID=A0ABQ7FBD0_9ACTN|nr:MULTISPECIES: VOC family protein [Streptomyces]KAF4406152.1 VOC family protein [Streptomyces lycii]PGH51924.1 glyoxalase [Streptomyces sp. Ru87]